MKNAECRLSPKGEELIDLYFPVLNSGFIALKDYMGTDNSIERAARVSYGKGTRKTSETRDLLRYLLRHKHTSPFEQCELVFHMRLPMDVNRQHVRHRTACLAEGTQIYFDLPAGKTDGSKYRRYNLTIEEVYRKFHKDSFSQKRITNMKLRHCNEDTMEINHTSIKNVFKNGIKPVYRIILEDNKVIECTKDHKFLFHDGWNTLSNKCNLQCIVNKAVYDKNEYWLYTNGFETNHIPWNKGKTYNLGPRKLSEKWKESNKKSRSGPASNFWKGGISQNRENIGRWTTQIAKKIHQKNGWTCQLCKERKSELHCHHIIPVWADESLAKDESNLTTLCQECHQKIHLKELDYAHYFTKSIIKTDYIPKKRIAHNKITIAKLVKIKEIVFIGLKETYDIEVNDKHHNFIANGIVTHNSLNEYSTRYSEAIDLCETTNPDEWRLQSKDNKQGSKGNITEWPEGWGIFINQENQEHHIEYVPYVTDGKDYGYEIEKMEVTPGEYLSIKEKDFHKTARELYEERLKFGMAKEQARKDLPLSTATEMYWKCDLHNLLHYLKLRCDKHAQLEIRSYANIMAGIVKELFPLTWEAFEDYTMNAKSFSANEMRFLLDILNDYDLPLLKKEAYPDNYKEYNMSSRENDEFWAKLSPTTKVDYTLDKTKAKSYDEFKI